GYVCLMFHRRDNHIIEMQLSDWSQQPDDVCNSSTFNSHSTPYTTFITSDPITRQCPNLGRYEIVSVLHSHNGHNAKDILSVDNEQNMANAAEVQDVRVTSTLYPGRCRYGSVRRLDIGCKTPDRMEFATSCSDETPSDGTSPSASMCPSPSRVRLRQRTAPSRSEDALIRGGHPGTRCMTRLTVTGNECRRRVVRMTYEACTYRVHESTAMRRHLDGHVVDLPDFRLGIHPGGAGHPIRQVHREVIPLSEETRPRDGRVVSYTNSSRGREKSNNGNDDDAPLSLCRGWSTVDAVVTPRASRGATIWDRCSLLRPASALEQTIASMAVLLPNFFLTDLALVDASEKTLPIGLN
ncbi:hypothetical protein WN48_01987, partial [Eufriesea mexicana]